MKDVVWVLPRLASVPRSGVDLRTHRLLAALASACDVRVVVVGDAEAEASCAATGVGAVEVFPRRNALGKAAAAASHRWPLGVAAAYSRSALRRIAELEKEGRTVIVDHPQMAPYMTQPERCILMTHNAEARLLSESPIPPAPLARLRRGWDAHATARLERRAVVSAGLVVAVSSTDAGLLEPGCVVVENGADLPAEVPPLESGGLVVFIGSLTYSPNREAIRWWSTAASVSGESTPLLTVVGGGVSDSELRGGMPGVQFVGEVASVEPWLTRARVVAIPLQHGGGTRLKVLEALAWGRPIVATTKAVEGLPVVHGVHALIVDDPAEFVAAVRQLGEQSALAQRLGDAGRRLAEDFAWDVISPRFVTAVDAFQQGKRAVLA